MEYIMTIFDHCEGQLALEDAAMGRGERDSAQEQGGMLDSSNRRPVLFIDTDLYVMKIWSEYVFDVAKRGF